MGEREINKVTEEFFSSAFFFLFLSENNSSRLISFYVIFNLSEYSNFDIVSSWSIFFLEDTESFIGQFATSSNSFNFLDFIVQVAYNVWHCSCSICSVSTRNGNFARKSPLAFSGCPAIKCFLMLWKQYVYMLNNHWEKKLLRLDPLMTFYILIMNLIIRSHCHMVTTLQINDKLVQRLGIKHIKIELVSCFRDTKDTINFL